MAEVYIWGRMDLTGHASISTGRSYESFHPVDLHVGHEKLARAGDVEKHWTSLEQDYANYGSPNQTINVNNVDEDDLYRSATLMDDMFPYYNLFNKNCSTVVASLLLAGHDRHYSSDFLDSIFHNDFWHELRAKMSYHEPHHSRNSHSWFETVMDSLEDSIFTVSRSSVARRHPAFRALAVVFASADLTLRQFVWTPGHVAALAKDIG
jgi:hypothetical protein